MRYEVPLLQEQQKVVSQEKRAMLAHAMALSASAAEECGDIAAAETGAETRRWARLQPQHRRRSSALSAPDSARSLVDTRPC